MPIAEASPALIWGVFIGAFAVFFGGIWWWASRSVNRERARIQQVAGALGLPYAPGGAEGLRRGSATDAHQAPVTGE